jgi:pimeloyl-ACP methyl ester carboxylesterase
MRPPDTQYAVAPDGIRIAYQVTGSGETDLVLMQGAAAHLELQWEDPKFIRLFERLSAFSRLIRFDRRGMGMSEILRELPSFDAQVEDFGVVMDAVGSERAALMGTIDAGALAVAFTAAHPERTRALVLFEVPPRFTRSETDDFGVDPEVVSRMAQAIQAMDIEGMASIVAPARMSEPGFLSWFRAPPAPPRAVSRSAPS